jgi:phosphatidylcholine synthase
VINAWLVHLYTASGALLGFIAAADITQSNYRGAFIWLTVATFVDSTDGVLARAARVSERIPWFDGALLDNIVDYITYVFVPALLVWQALLVPDAWSIPICAAMLLSSGYGFSRADAKTGDHFFTGFPSYWNIVAFYLFVAGWPAWVNAVILVVLSLLVFVPVRYVYPSRTPVLRVPTVVLGAAWAIAMVLLVADMPEVSRPLLWASLAYPVYYVVLSLALTLRRGETRPHTV